TFTVPKCVSIARSVLEPVMTMILPWSIRSVCSSPMATVVPSLPTMIVSSSPSRTNGCAGPSATNHVLPSPTARLENASGCCCANGICMLILSVGTPWFVNVGSSNVVAAAMMPVPIGVIVELPLTEMVEELDGVGGGGGGATVGPIAVSVGG